VVSGGGGGELRGILARVRMVLYLDLKGGFGFIGGHSRWALEFGVFCVLGRVGCSRGE
jgi:hypothetical protein